MDVFNFSEILFESNIKMKYKHKTDKPKII